MLFWGRKSQWGIVWVSLACGPIYRRMSWLHPVWVALFPRFGSCTAGVSMRAIIPHECNQLLQAPAAWLPCSDGQQLGSEPSSSKLRHQCVLSQEQQRKLDPLQHQKDSFLLGGAHTSDLSQHTGNPEHAHPGSPGTQYSQQLWQRLVPLYLSIFISFTFILSFSLSSNPTVLWKIYLVWGKKNSLWL